LLRTIYPSAAFEAIEPDTGNASNDEVYTPTQTIAGQPPLSVISRAPVRSDDDDAYYLGGYAGI
jgi:hypothetical protein